MDWDIYEIAWMFLCYSLIGWLWETPFVSIKQKKFVNRGFLRGPVIPIYGFAATTIMLSMGAIDSHLNWHPWINMIVSMVYIAFIASIWEYVTSYAMEELFKTRWWNYTHHRFNIKGRIALDVSVFWGIGGYLLWNFVNIPIMNLYASISMDTMVVMLGTAYSIIMVDAGFTLVELINLRNVVVKLHDASEEVIAQLTFKMGQISDNIEGFSESFTENISDQRQNFIRKIDEAKSTLKNRAQYRNYEGFQAFSDFSEDMKGKWKSWVNESDLSLTRFSELLGKAKNHVRFFKNYPNASTKQFELMFITRRQDEENKKNKNENNKIKKNNKND